MNPSADLLSSAKETRKKGVIKQPRFWLQCPPASAKAAGTKQPTESLTVESPIRSCHHAPIVNPAKQSRNRLFYISIFQTGFISHT